MPSSVWVWEQSLRHYRNVRTGRFIGINEMNTLRVTFMNSQKAYMEGLVVQYYEGSITLSAFEVAVKKTLKETYIDMYGLGAGGRHALSQADWGRIGAMLKEQYGKTGYLGNMMAQIANEQVSPAQAIARLNMYVNSANEALWRGYLSDMGFQLPAYPGDGSTVCLTNCQCTWEIVAVEDGYDCYWRLGDTEHCPDCLQRSIEWNPWHWPEV